MAGWWVEHIATPKPAPFKLIGHQPVVRVTADQIITPTPGVLTLTGHQPGVMGNQVLHPTPGVLTLTGQQPGVRVSNDEVAVPQAGALVLTGLQPGVTVTENRYVTPTPGSLLLTGQQPGVAVTQHQLITPTRGLLTLTGQQPGVSVHPALNFIDSAAADAATCPIPTHQAGDLIVLFSYRASNVAVPLKPTAGGTVPAWVDIDAVNGANTNGSRTAYFVALNSSTTSGTWTNANSMIAVVIRGQNASPIGGHAESGSTGDPATAPSVSMLNTIGTSIVLHFFGQFSASSWASAPTGYTKRPTVGATGVALLTKNVTTSDGSVSLSSGSSSRYRAATVEVVA